MERDTNHKLANQTFRESSFPKEKLQSLETSKTCSVSKKSRLKAYQRPRSNLPPISVTKSSSLPLFLSPFFLRKKGRGEEKKKKKRKRSKEELELKTQRVESSIFSIHETYKLSLSLSFSSLQPFFRRTSAMMDDETARKIKQIDRSPRSGDILHTLLLPTFENQRDISPSSCASSPPSSLFILGQCSSSR